MMEAVSLLRLGMTLIISSSMARLRYIIIAALVSLSVLLPSCTKETQPGTIVQKDTLVIVSSGSLGQTISVQQYGVLPTNTAAQNKTALQKAIDAAARKGANLYVTPCESGYKCDGGIILRGGVTLGGAKGSIFVITDTQNPFISMESSSCIQGIQFSYPDQTCTDASKIKEYKPTLTLASGADVEGITARDLDFYGEYAAMDFRPSGGKKCGQLLIEDCFGYSLGGCFVAIGTCIDTPRILHCGMDSDYMGFTASVIDAVVAKAKWGFSLENTLGAILMDINVSGDHGGLWLGPQTSGQITSFSMDCVTIGIGRDGDSNDKRDWEISQGSINANVGAKSADIHPFLIQGMGHTSIAAVNACSDKSDVLDSFGKSFDYIDIEGDKELTVVMINCSMKHYEAAFPITINNGNAKVRALSCVDDSGNFFDYTTEIN